MHLRQTWQDACSACRLRTSVEGTAIGGAPRDLYDVERQNAQRPFTPARWGVIWPVPFSLALNGPFDFPSWEMFALPPSVSVARLRKRWTLSPMNSSASVDHTPVGSQCGDECHGQYHKHNDTSTMNGLGHGPRDCLALLSLYQALYFQFVFTVYLRSTNTLQPEQA